MGKMKRTGIYQPEEVMELLDAYTEKRPHKSRNKALTELLLYVLAPETLEVRPEVVEDAIQASRTEDGDVQDGDW